MPDIRFTSQLDDFNRADESPLSNGGRWALTDGTLSGYMALTSLYATHALPGSTGDEYWTTLFTPSTREVEVWGTPFAGGAGASGIAWALDLWQQPGGTSQVDGYRFRDESSSGGAQFFLYRVANGVATNIASGAAGFPTAFSTYRMLLRRNGGDVEGWFSTDDGANWSLVASATDSTYTGSFYVGMGIRDNSSNQLLGWKTIGGGAGTEFIPQIYRRIYTTPKRRESGL